MTLLRQLSLRLDALQVRSDLLTPGGDAKSSGLANVDIAARELLPDLTNYQILVGGWGFICSPGLSESVTDMGRTYVVIR